MTLACTCQGLFLSLPRLTFPDKGGENVMGKSLAEKEVLVTEIKDLLDQLGDGGRSITFLGSKVDVWDARWRGGVRGNVWGGKESVSTVDR